MSAPKQAFFGCDIFDGTVRHLEHAMLVEAGRIASIVPANQVPSGHDLIRLDGGLVSAGFVDLQVNGGNGILLNDSPTVDGIRSICEAHLPFGTTSLLPTLITDTHERTIAAIRAGQEAQEQRVAGCIGLHLEGPHLALNRQGAHDPALIRAMDATDLDRLVAAAEGLESLLITVALESASLSQIRTLASAGIIVSLGHTDASYAAVLSAVESGASCVTHLFNAMSPLTHREPGVVGAALQLGGLSAGLIADGFHINPAAISIALRAKQTPGRIFLVTDAMSTIGTNQREIFLRGRRILREGGCLTLENGTLAGADLDMISAVRFMVREIHLSLEEALRMASLYPAQVLGRESEIGQLTNGANADFVLINANLEIVQVWRSGKLAYSH